MVQEIFQKMPKIEINAKRNSLSENGFLGCVKAQNVFFNENLTLENLSLLLYFFQYEKLKIHEEMSKIVKIFD